MANIRLLTDSASDISEKHEKKYNIKVVNFKIAIGDKSYTSRVDFNNEKFYDLMDAYDDLPADRRRRRYNPLRSLSERPDYEPFMERLLTMTIAEATGEFERLPLVKDINILRNILYSGVWCKYALIRKRRRKAQAGETPAPEGEKP